MIYMKYKVGDKVRINEHGATFSIYSTGEVGVITEIIISKFTDSYFYIVKVPGKCEQGFYRNQFDLIKEYNDWPEWL